MNRADFIFTIGYKGDTAIVDAGAQKENKDTSCQALLEKGLYRAAFCAALFDDENLEFCASKISQKTGGEYSVESLKRLFGVFQIPIGCDA